MSCSVGDMTRSNATSPTSTSPENSVKNDKKKKSIIPKIFGSKRVGKSRADGDAFSRRSDADADDDVALDSEMSKVASRRKAFLEASPVIRKSFSERQTNPRIEGLDLSSYCDLSMAPEAEVREYRIFVGTWNVGGRTPTTSLNLEDFLRVEGSTDLYVLGFQEIVPLSAGNVLVAEDNEPASKWLFLINQALNRPNYDSDSSNHSSDSHTDKQFFQKPSLKLLSKNLRADTIFLKSCNCHLPAAAESPLRETMRATRKRSGNQSSRKMEFGTQSGPINSARVEELLRPRNNQNGNRDGNDNNGERLSSPMSLFPCDYSRYRLVASKQMVGLFLTVWARSELMQHVGHLRVTCIGRGIMGRLGNKGCVSVSMCFHQTSFCFVCSHLASGEKEGDELRRNADVTEILKSTQFSKICRSADRRDPEKILDHDRVIWMGDLNYRLSLSYEETRSLLEDNDWDALLEKDQLNVERKEGRVFSGFNEGRIFFAPTYKYSHNSDSYAGETGKSKKKRRTPAWCDRILWRGNGIEQLSYIRGESRFSDHRPVCSVFSVQVEMKSRKPNRFRKGFSCAVSRADYDDCMSFRHGSYEL